MSSHTQRSILPIHKFRRILTSPNTPADAKVEAISVLWQAYYDKSSAFFNATHQDQAAYFEVLRDVALDENVDSEARTNALGALRTGAKKFTHAEPILRAAFDKLPKVILKGDASLLVEAAVRGFDQTSWEAYGRPETTLGKKPVQAAKAQAA